MIEARVRASFERQRFMATLGARLTRVADGEVDIACDVVAVTGEQEKLVATMVGTMMAVEGRGLAD